MTHLRVNGILGGVFLFWIVAGLPEVGFASKAYCPPHIKAAIEANDIQAVEAFLLAQRKKQFFSFLPLSVGQDCLDDAIEKSKSDIVSLLLTGGGKNGSPFAYASEDTNGRLIAAAKKGDTQLVTMLLTLGPRGKRAKAQDNHNQALLQAAAHGHLETVAVLVNVGRAKEQDENYCEAMVEAARGGHGAIVNLLLGGQVIGESENWFQVIPSHARARCMGHIKQAGILAAQNHHAAVLRLLFRMPWWCPSYWDSQGVLYAPDAILSAFFYIFEAAVQGGDLETVQVCLIASVFQISQQHADVLAEMAMIFLADANSRGDTEMARFLRSHLDFSSAGSYRFEGCLLNATLVSDQDLLAKGWDKTESCAICLEAFSAHGEEMESNDFVSVMPHGAKKCIQWMLLACDHIFHKHCIECAHAHAQQSGRILRCPLCRAN
jgi:ankyrin repeat protein